MMERVVVGKRKSFRRGWRERGKIMELACKTGRPGTTKHEYGT